MARADGGAGLGARPGRRWDVALSFAGAQRDYVAQVAAVLKARGVRCFYDADEQVRLWGTHLAEELPRIYARESAVVVVFVSADYAEGNWTRLECRVAFSRAVLESGAYVLPARFDDSELPALVPDVVAVDLRRYTPGQFADLVVAKLADLASSPSPSLGVDRGPPGGVRVSEADPRRLGVHAAITIPGVSGDVLPEYVPRDADAAAYGVRAKVVAAAERGGFVLLVGGSSVGKTRCAVEAVKALLPDWWLVHPAGAAGVAALAAAPSPQTVVWLDELQRYLDGEHGLTGGRVRALLGAPHPAVIVGTLWPDRYTAYTTLPAPGGADPHAREREVLELADVVRIGPAFSEAEQGRARVAAARDRRLAIALDTTDYGLTQTVAAAPQLVARWEDAQTASPYAWAVLTAALDVVRLGARAPLSTGLLRAAAPGYCTSQQQARAREDWFEQALAYATSTLHGAAAALSPAGAGMSRVAGYIVADYLVQHASRVRRCSRVPSSAWDAVLSHISDPADAARLAGSARNRLLYRYAIPLYRHAADAGDRAAAWRLADLLKGRGDLDGLRARADAGDGAAAWRLADLLKGCGDLDGFLWALRAAANAGDPDAAEQLAELLYVRGDVDALRARAERGDERGAQALADLLADRGDLDGLRARADGGDWRSGERLAELLEEHGNQDGAEQVLRAAADAGGEHAAMRLARLLEGRSDADALRARADAGDKHAAFWLAVLLARCGDLDGLRARAERGDVAAASTLAGQLEWRGDLDGAARILRAWAQRGDEEAAGRLANLLARRGDTDGLRARAEGGDWRAARTLADLLAQRGDTKALGARANSGDWYAGDRLADLLAQRGDTDGLRARADAGDQDAAWRLANLLVGRGDLDGTARILRAWPEVGNSEAGRTLADLLARGGDTEALRARSDAGDGHAALRLAELLEGHGDLDRAEQVLRAAADAGNEQVGWRLSWLLAKQGRGEEAERLRRFGLNPDGSIASASRHVLP
jgi:TIR domain